MTQVQKVIRAKVGVLELLLRTCEGHLPSNQPS